MNLRSIKHSISGVQNSVIALRFMICKDPIGILHDSLAVQAQVYRSNVRYRRWWDLPAQLITLKDVSLVDENKKQTRIMLKNGVFWVVTPCGSCKNRRFGGTWRFAAYVGC
jgi:hypothetical protein